MIFFEKIRWKNFLSTGNVFTEIDLCSNKTTLIVGNNGSGKSTLLDAISFLLFGKAFRKINKPQLINSITEKNLVVEGEFSIGKTKYKIIRGMKPNVFEIYENEILINQSAESSDYQEYLEKHIIKSNHKSFCQVDILGSATFQPFMQLTAAARRDFIEDLLDLQIFTTMNTLLKDKISLNKEEIEACVLNKKHIEEKIVIINEHIKKIQNNNEKFIEEKKNKITQTDEQISQFNEIYNSLSEKLKLLEDKTEDDKTLKTKLNTLNNLKHKIEANLGLINKDIDFFNNHDDCPTCKQPIDADFKCLTIENKQKEVIEIESGLVKLTNQYDSLNKKISDIMKINDEIFNIRNEQYKCRSKINTLIEYKEQLNQDILSVQTQNSIDESYKINELEKELEKNQITYNTLIDDKNTLAAASSLLKDGGIKSKIIKQYIPIINKLINKYLSSMEFMCHFELDEQFNEKIKSRYRDEFSYESFSEGEKMRINLAILFTWRAIAKLRNSINTNILIMDEVFDSSLDINGTEEFLKIINDLTNDTNTFIISHKTDQLYDKFEKVIKFEKYKNFSRIV